MINNELVLTERTLDLPIPVLFVSANQKEHARLRLLLKPLHCLVYGASTFADARKMVRDHEISVVITEAALSDGVWTTLFVCTGPKDNPPFVIPLAELGDSGFWVDALNQGAFDVLFRPVSTASLAPIVTLAFRRWKRAAERRDARAENNTQVTLIWPTGRSRAKTTKPKWVAPKVLAVAGKSFAATQGSSRLVWW